MSFIIWAPPYRDSSSGIRALYRLCHWLNVMGADAYVVADPWEAPPADWAVRRCQVTTVPADAVVVYPEIVVGNPLGAKTVARWVLNHPGALGGETVYAPDEHIFYSPQVSGPDVFRASAQAAAGDRDVIALGTSVHEPHLFYPSSGKRSGTCYFVYKGQAAFLSSGGMFPTNEWHLITPAAPVSRVDLAYLFHRIEALYSWDPHSGLTRESAICGVRTYIVEPDGNLETVPQPNYEEVILQYLTPPVGIERLLELAR